jgi:hypothetical protein
VRSGSAGVEEDGHDHLESRTSPGVPGEVSVDGLGCSTK